MRENERGEKEEKKKEEKKEERGNKTEEIADEREWGVSG